MVMYHASTINSWVYLGVAILGLHAQTAARTCGRELGLPGNLMSNLLLTMELGISYHMKQKYFIQRCLQGFNVAHCKCTNTKFDN